MYTIGTVHIHWTLPPILVPSKEFVTETNKKKIYHWETVLKNLGIFL